MKHDASLFGEVVGAVVERIQYEIQRIESGCVRRILHEIRIQLLCKMSNTSQRIKRTINGINPLCRAIGLHFCMGPWVMSALSSKAARTCVLRLLTYSMPNCWVAIKLQLRRFILL